MSPPGPKHWFQGLFGHLLKLVAVDLANHVLAKKAVLWAGPPVMVLKIQKHVPPRVPTGPIIFGPIRTAEIRVLWTLRKFNPRAPLLAHFCLVTVIKIQRNVPPRVLTGPVNFRPIWTAEIRVLWTWCKFCWLQVKWPLSIKIGHDLLW